LSVGLSSAGHPMTWRESGTGLTNRGPSTAEGVVGPARAHGPRVAVRGHGYSENQIAA